tara:strand:+ start:3951 stop:5012 length:1062 start_codon:yes stop_codon:yes gene_type:complete
MSPAEFLRELTLPARSLPVVFTLVAFLLLLASLTLISSLSPVAGLGLALVFALFLLPGLMRFLMQVTEDRARGRSIEPPTAEQFMLLSSIWPLLPFALGVGAAVVCAYLRQRFGEAPAAAVAILFAFALPGSVGVLAITHSAVQSINPLAIARYISATGLSYLYAVFTLTALALLCMPLSGVGTSTRAILGGYLLFALFAVIGRIALDDDLVNEVDIPEPETPGEAQQTASILAERTGVLNHAYGLASRGNRDGALRFVTQELGADPQADEAWAWFFAQMLRWENPATALYFAQHYLARLLAAGETVKAVKLMLRCRMENDAFRPFTDDLPAAIEAARLCANDELAQALETGL